MIRSALPTALFSAVLIATFGGCANEAPDAGEPSQPSASQTQDPEIAEALASLSPEDRALAEKQKICPVTKEPLGSMGTPEKVEIEGRSVFVCCAGCIDMLKENPDEYLPNLPG